METKKIYVHTIGCQMNVYDSDKIISHLRPLGYKATNSLEMADLIIVNTCSIREKAEQKAFSFVGRLAKIKQKNRSLIIAVGGCLAQQAGKKILAGRPWVDIVFGTHAIGRLPKMIQQVTEKKNRIVDVKMSETIQPGEFDTDSSCNSDVSGFITIMRGCDNYCTYCVVPHVRGREASRQPKDIISEIKAIVADGAREVTLLGQNVNSYGLKENMLSFPELLKMVNEIKGLFRIRFTTSHPKDLSNDLMNSFKNLDKLCNHIHLPVQSGSDDVLRRMNRKYTRRIYLEKVDNLRQICPEIAITSDIIVGFPGETAQDFKATLSLMERVGFDGLFAFIYSDRANAAAAHFSNKVAENEKKERLQILLNLQEKYTLLKNQSQVGKIETVLVDGLSKKQAALNSCENDLNNNLNYQSFEKAFQWTGRTSANKIVNFCQNGNYKKKPVNLAGMLIDVEIEKALAHSLWGKSVKAQSLSHLNDLKGE